MRRGHLPQSRVGNGEHGALFDPRYLMDHVLDLGRIDFRTARNNDVPRPVNQCDKASVINPRQIASGHPAVTKSVEGVGFRRLLGVLKQGARSAHTKFAGHA